MADEKEFDRSAAGQRLQGFARRAQSIRDELTNVINFYWEQLPTNAEDEDEYKKSMRRKLGNQMDALRDIINSL